MKFPIVLIEAHSRCNCRCEMCDIWKSPDTREFSLADLEAQLPSLEQLGTRWLVFTGGEPLMHSDLFALCRPLRARGIEVSILSTGLLFERYAAQIVENIDSAIVSLDGPPELHDSIRHTPGGFAMIERGVARIRELRPDFPISARTVVQRRNHNSLTATAAAAKRMALNSISFLAADLSSTAFNRTEPWPIVRQNKLALGPEHLSGLDIQLAELTLDPFVIDSPSHLSRIADHFRAHLGLLPFKAPRCNAPWVSALLTASGNVQPCFFHPTIGTLENDSLMQILTTSPFRDSLNVATNPTCQRCVCSLYLETNA